MESGELRAVYVQDREGETATVRAVPDQAVIVRLEERSLTLSPASHEVALSKMKLDNLVLFAIPHGGGAEDGFHIQCVPRYWSVISGVVATVCYVVSLFVVVVAFGLLGIDDPSGVSAALPLAIALGPVLPVTSATMSWLRRRTGRCSPEDLAEAFRRGGFAEILNRTELHRLDPQREHLNKQGKRWLIGMRVFVTVVLLLLALAVWAITAGFIHFLIGSDRSRLAFIIASILVPGWIALIWSPMVYYQYESKRRKVRDPGHVAEGEPWGQGMLRATRMAARIRTAAAVVTHDGIERNMPSWEELTSRPKPAQWRVWAAIIWPIVALIGLIAVGFFRS